MANMHHHPVPFPHVITARSNNTSNWTKALRTMFTFDKLIIALGITAFLRGHWHPGVLLGLYAEAAVPAGTNLTSYPVRYIEGWCPGEDSFILASGLRLQDQDTYHSFAAVKNTTCLTTCKAHPPCMGVSSEFVNDQVLCKMTIKQPRFISLVISFGASFLFKTDVIPNLYYGVQTDKMLYMIANDSKVQNSAKNLCSRIPGHRLGIFQTLDQYNALLRLHATLGQDILVDMKTANNGLAMWGDGTYFQNTPLAPAVALAAQNDGVNASWRVSSNGLSDMPPNTDKYYVCQANPLGQNW